MSHREAYTDRILKACKVLNVEPEIATILDHCKDMTQVQFPLRRDDGTLDLLTGWRCRHNPALGPTRGALTFAADLDASAVELSAKLTTMRSALVGLPFGGAAGGIRVNPNSLSKHECEQMSRGYVRALARVFLPEIDIPGPGKGSNGQPISWMADELQTLSQRHVPQAITGKALAQGGIPGRDVAAGFGGFAVLLDTLSRLNSVPQETTVAIQGFSHAGYHAAVLLAQEGMDIVAVSDGTGMAADPSGLDPDTVMRHRSEKGVLPSGRGETGSATGETDILASDCDVLILAGDPGSVTLDRARRIKARIILELSDHVIEPDADDYLVDHGHIVIPDVLANSGEGTACYAEWVQGRQATPWSEERVFAEIEERLESAADAAWEWQRKLGGSLRDAAYVAALEWLSRAIKETL